MLALSELNMSTEPPALTVSSSVAKLIADEDCADTRLAIRARTSSADTSSDSDATTLTSTALAALSPPLNAVTDPALDKDADELDTEMSAPDPSTSSDVSATNEADALLAAIDVSASTDTLSLVTRIDSAAIASNAPPADTDTVSELTDIDSPDTSSSDLEADTLTPPDAPPSSITAPALPTRTLSLPDTSTVDPAALTSPLLSNDTLPAATDTSPAKAAMPRPPPESVPPAPIHDDTSPPTENEATELVCAVRAAALNSAVPRLPIDISPPDATDAPVDATATTLPADDTPISPVITSAEPANVPFKPPPP
jgi:hypothetical protein